jgi:hypothetical protein
MPQSKRLASLAALVTVALGMPVALLACWPTTGGTSTSSSGAAVPTTDPPVIQSLDMDNSALTPSPNDTYLINGSITYTDDDDVVTGFQVEIPVIGKTYSFPADKPYVSTIAGSPISFTVSADPPLGGAGPTTYFLSLVNQGGAVSAASQQSMDLE